ncbi:MAG TPA: HD domain-containing protein, partial [Bryobacterales bacterium]|nr:HD domain-containing protein [Bryobacterales bacterium]
RYLAGDRAALAHAAERLPSFYIREKEALIRGLAKLTRARHAKHGDTIYHLEPNIKEVPGGIRDFQVACWLAQLAHITPGALLPGAEQYLPDESRAELLEAKRFLFALRCYLHYFNERDNNILTFEHQERAAAEGRGKCFPDGGDAAAWMRDYFRNVRVIRRLAARLLEEVATPEHSLFAMFRDRKSRLSNPDFAVTRGQLYVRHPEALETEPGLMLRLFEFIARHGVPLAPETERRVSRAVPAFRMHLEQARRIELPLWPPIASVLKMQHAYAALVAMRETGVLAALFPEYERIDCLVVRDFYHRYTVDEHSLRTIKHLHELRGADDPLTRHFAELMEEIEQPELLFLALLFHDAGKGGGEGDHVSTGLELAEQAMDRIQMGEQDRETVRFLIRHHLEMSATMTRRDLADPETARYFAGRVSTLERLRKLTLMTYADIAAVNPEALTPWRKDLLWQLYVATHNQLTREMEAERIEAEQGPAAPPFLEGLPTRYLRTHAAEQIAEHGRLAAIFQRRSIAINLSRRHSLYEVVVLAADRPFLFASIAGTISSFAMNIVKAEAFSNSEGMVLDTLVFSDPNRNLELNPSEADRFRSTLEHVVLGKIDVRELLQKRRAPASLRRPRVPRQIAFDNETASNETLFHVITEDRPGLLYDLASTFSFNRCDIDVVLIDTEGNKAVDVFYVRSKGRKLSSDKARDLCEELDKACRGEE